MTQTFTDNAELTTSKMSDLSYGIESRVALNHVAPRLSYDLGFSLAVS